MSVLSKQLIGFLKEKFGEDAKFTLSCNEDSSVLIEHEWCGDTETGFHSEFEIDWEKLELEMSEFIKGFGS